MTDDKRAAIAFICGTKNDRGFQNRVYDLHRMKYLHYTISWNESGFSLYDSNRNSFMNGTESSIFDFCTKSYISIIYSEDYFSGYDYESNCDFNGSVVGDRVSIFDTEKSKFFDYTII